MINLPNFKILDMKESAHDYRFLVESTALSPSHCPKCGTVANLYKHGKKQQLFFDLPMHAKRVGIYVNRQRYKCRECNETFFEDLPDMDVNCSVTNRLINWIQETSLEKHLPVLRRKLALTKRLYETSLMTTLLNLKRKLILEFLNGLVLMKFICLKITVV
ncbi:MULTISPECIES: transposase family protein [unclassified Oceanobacillus]|uniref:transposase family protein n=2 Tax=Oceanobacillus TaxID=182709 RepID=UPI0012EBC8F1